MLQNRAICVLVSPIDWGLGHATRCIPVINELLKHSVRVLVAASGPQQSLLKQEFPGVEFLEIPGYEVRYKPGFLLKWSLLLRIPAILKQIKREQGWLAECLQKYKVDAVISDNRYGLYHKNIFCVFITHQLYIQSGLAVYNSGWRRLVTGAAASWIEQKMLKWNYSFVSKFSECWIPDQPGIHSIAGKLAWPPILPPVPLKYIGLLTRFKPIGVRVEKKTLLILLSGPEPSRTIFENILFMQLADTALKTVVVRGLPGEELPVPSIKGIEIHNHLPTGKLNTLLKSAEFIIARSGYSTVMDLMRLKKNAILVPTPGQTEQEYLGTYLHEKKWMITVPQKNFNIAKSIAAFQKIEFDTPGIQDNLLENVTGEFLKTISEKKALRVRLYSGL